MKLSELLSSVGLDGAQRTGDADLTGISADSRHCAPGCLFVCMPSPTRDTHEFLPKAKAAGASAALVHTPEGMAIAKAQGLAAAMVPPGEAFNAAAGFMARSLFGDPSAKMRVIAITGTNGKTTTTWMLRDALRALGRRSAYLGTLGFQAGSPLRTIPNTTPFPVETWQLLDEAARDGVEDLAMEASSHALFERRLAGVRFDVGLFTNLTQDHLDFHKTMEAYGEAKRLLFTEYAERSGKPFRAALNIADPTGRRWASEMPAAITFGAPDAQLVVEPVDVQVASLRLRAAYGGRQAEAALGVGGLFNVENATSTLAALVALGYGLEEGCRALEGVTPVPGRFEAIPNDEGIGVIVDYAHTPDALQHLLDSARALKPKRIIAVFGCGGDRDRTKRPIMARTVSERSEVTVVTSDNPRTEDPQAILADTVPGLVPGATHRTIVDRREAIFEAIKLAQPGDVVVIAGKGHEDYQIIGRVKHHMDDREMAREALGARR